MTQLGHEWRTRAGKAQDRLGVCASSSSQLLSPEALDAAFAWFDKGGRAPLLIKSNRLSAVHRRVLLDLIVVPEMKGKARSEEHTSELQSLMRKSYAVLCLKKKKIQRKQNTTITNT